MNQPSIQSSVHLLIQSSICPFSQLSTHSSSRLSAHRVAGNRACGEPTRGRKTAWVEVVHEVLTCGGLLLLHRGVGVADDVERGASRHTRLERRLDWHRRRVPHVARRVLIVRVYSVVLTPWLPPCHAPVAHPRPRQRARLLSTIITTIIVMAMTEEDRTWPL